MSNPNSTKVFIRKNGHANKHSLPLRYGVSFVADHEFQLVEKSSIEKSSNKRFSNRFELDAEFELEAKANLAHVVIALLDKDRSQYPPLQYGCELVTLWNPKKEKTSDAEAVSALIRTLEENGIISTPDLLGWHDTYVETEKFDFYTMLTLLVSSEKFPADVFAEITENRTKLNTSGDYEFMKLEKVNENVPYGKYNNLCTELIFDSGEKRYMVKSKFDCNGRITEKAKSLEGFSVITECFEPQVWEKYGYFCDIHRGGN